MNRTKTRKSLREQAGNTSETLEGKVFPNSPHPVGVGLETPETGTPDTSRIRASHDPSPWLTPAEAEEIAESMATGYDARGAELIPPRRLSVAEYRHELEREVERWGGYVWWIS